VSEGYDKHDQCIFGQVCSANVDKALSTIAKLFYLYNVDCVKN